MKVVLNIILVECGSQFCKGKAHSNCLSIYTSLSLMAPIILSLIRVLMSSEDRVSTGGLGTDGGAKEEPETDQGELVE